MAFLKGYQGRVEYLKLFCGDGRYFLCFIGKQIDKQGKKIRLISKLKHLTKEQKTVVCGTGSRKCFQISDIRFATTF
jgi:hypothetical protein